MTYCYVYSVDFLGQSAIMYLPYLYKNMHIYIHLYTSYTSNQFAGICGLITNAKHAKDNTR